MECNISLRRLYILRAMYLFIAVGLSLSIGPDIIDNIGLQAGPYTVINAFLFSMIVLALLGIRYPVALLPILFFELIWKLMWLLAYALPLHLSGELDDYAAGVAFAALMGVILTPLVIPWGYVVRKYILQEGDNWR